MSRREHLCWTIESKRGKKCREVQHFPITMSMWWWCVEGGIKHLVQFCLNTIWHRWQVAVFVEIKEMQKQLFEQSAFGCLPVVETENPFFFCLKNKKKISMKTGVNNLTKKKKTFFNKEEWHQKMYSMVLTSYKNSKTAKS